jgi:hypothetical protein
MVASAAAPKTCPEPTVILVGADGRYVPDVWLARVVMPSAARNSEAIRYYPPR